ncbi:MAG: GNAT family N-acetyltransferase [Candidatus Bathyarchaeia archaeon]
MILKILSDDDPGLEPFKEKLSRHVRQAEMLGMPYWVFFEDADPIGVVDVGQEPVMLLEPLGTPLSTVRAIDPERQMETLKEFAKRSLELSREKGVEYSYFSVPARHEAIVSAFEEAGFRELADTYRMVCRLQGPYEPSGGLRFEAVGREELDGFIENAIECMSGSPDMVLTIILENLKKMRGVSEDLLDLWYGLETLYQVYANGELVGILDLNVKEGVVGNVGVAPKHRGKGYGRQIMLFGLRKLEEEGRERASLRVHVDNERAIRLYESLGFSVDNRIKHLIWRKQGNGTDSGAATALGQIK